MLKLAEAERLPRARFEMTPIMDVVFLLIVFFLYALVRMHVSTAVEVELPEATENGKDAARDVLVLTLAEGGGVWVGDEAAADDAAAVEMLAAGKLPRAVLLRCDKAVPVGRALEMLSRLERAGIGDVAFETARPAAEPAGAGSEK